MRFLSALNKAKTQITYDEQILAKLESSISPAVEEIKILLGKKEFIRYYNSPEELPIKSISAGDIDGFTVISFEYPVLLKQFDDLIVSGTSNCDGYHEVYSVSEDKKSVTIELPFIGTAYSGVVKLAHIAQYDTALAWLVCYYTTFAVQKIRDDKVLVTSEQYGEGDIKSFSIKDIKEQREQYLRNAYMILGQIEVRKR